MKTKLDDFFILSKVFLGNRLVITFQHQIDISYRWVLELTDIVGFKDGLMNDELYSIRIQDGGGSYPFDLSHQLKRPEIADFQEVFLFSDASELNVVFRACARSIELREWE
ncbi:hypothetical protein [Chitinophaga caseinilytica]|uniref:Uncharacterized protein n=1 Tax=Chitinophaga caseinilytica TaxID=2267521 RepID=A0ABZ2Z2V1_9BACT